MARRQHLALMVTLAVLGFLTLMYLMSPTSSSLSRYPKAELLNPSREQALGSRPGPEGQQREIAKQPGGDAADFGLPSSILTGGAIAPKLENKTAKAELGRASWKLLHTMMARFPEQPTSDDSLALKTYVRLFARLYPCGDCATHFQKLLAKYPPQTSSRNAAAGWACFVHNEVNQRLEKPLFDCNMIGDFYDCGCGDDDKHGGSVARDGEHGLTTAVKAKQERQRDDGADSVAHITIEKEEG